MGEGPLDLMTFLQQKYLQAIGEKGLPSLDSFIEFARKYLAEVNQPLNVCFMPRGLGLRMQHGETVGFIVEQPEQTQMRDEGIHVTRPRTIPGMHGINDISSVPVFGGR